MTWTWRSRWSGRRVRGSPTCPSSASTGVPQPLRPGDPRRDAGADAMPRKGRLSKADLSGKAARRSAGPVGRMPRWNRPSTALGTGARTASGPRKGGLRRRRGAGGSGRGRPPPRASAAREGASRALRRRMTGALTGKAAIGRPRRGRARTGMPAGRRRLGRSLYVPQSERPIESFQGAPTDPVTVPYSRNPPVAGRFTEKHGVFWRTLGQGD